jgi:DNA-binding NarL/FixJ family response regulator
MHSENASLGPVQEKSRHAVLLLTHDDSLWDRWRALDPQRWMPARGQSLAELNGWKNSGRCLALVDLSMPQNPGSTSNEWEKATADMTLLAASSHPTETEASQMLAMGFSGYLHAYSPLAVIDSALGTVQAGGVWLGRQLMTHLLREIDKRLPSRDLWAQSLTLREKEVAERAARGESNQHIADSLNISERTVRAHMSSVFEKLDVGDRLMLALKVHGIN